MASARSPFDDMTVDHIRYYAVDLEVARRWLVNGYGFSPHTSTDPASGAGERSLGLGRNDIRFVVTQPDADDHPGTAYLARHGDGVGDIALGVPDAEAAYTEAVGRGARPVSPPRRAGGVVTATVGGFGDVTHTFVQRDSGVDGWALPDMVPVGPRYPETGGLTDVDHFAVCVESGQLDATVEFYERVLGFDLIFAEQVVIGAQAMTTKVVESTSRAVTLTIIEPDVSRVAGHIDEFLADHGGPGVQHIAFTVDDIVAAVESLSARGIGFLATPATYYAMLPERVRLARYTVDELRSHHILVDQDHDGQLYQIFTESVHPRNTIFMEVIERLGARSFGSGNIKALYQAVEAQRHRDDAAAA